jgi:branched-chain amino acid transport system permease protein
VTPAAETNAMITMLLVYATTATLRVGIFSIAPVGFAACGGYTVAIFLTKTSVPFPLAVLIAIAGTVAIAIALAIPLLRLLGIYAALATLAFLIVVQGVIESLTITGGSLGIFAIPFSDMRAVLAIAIVITLGIWYWVDHSFVGRHLDTIAENPVLAASMGINVPMLRLATIVYSAVVAAFAGGLYARSFYVLSPGVFDFSFAISIAALAVIAGSGHWVTPFVSTATIGLIPIVFTGLGNWGLILQGGLMTLVVMVYPDGIAGVARRLLSPQRAVLATDNRTRSARVLAWL